MHVASHCMHRVSPQRCWCSCCCSASQEVLCACHTFLQLCLDLACEPESVVPAWLLKQQLLPAVLLLHLLQQGQVI
jgi:hypothetical protein